MLMAYNHDVSGGELVPLVEAILRAANEVNYASAYRLGSDGSHITDESKVNTNEVEGCTEGECCRNTDGSWRLLLDQNNVSIVCG